jgi:hypothetical protein
MSKKIIERTTMTEFKAKRTGERMGRIQETPGGMKFYKKSHPKPHMKITLQKLLLVLELIGDFQKEKSSKNKFEILTKFLKIIQNGKNNESRFDEIMEKLTLLKPYQLRQRLSITEREMFSINVKRRKKI